MVTCTNPIVKTLSHFFNNKNCIRVVLEKMSYFHLHIAFTFGPGATASVAAISFVESRGKYGMKSLCLITSLCKTGKLHTFLMLTFYWQEPSHMAIPGLQAGWEMWSRAGRSCAA